MEKTIRIECEGTLFVTIDELKELHNYAEITDEHYEHLKNSFEVLGFKFPVFIWIDEAGMKWIIDAHGRKKTLTRMRDKEGYTIPSLPAVRIFAKDKIEAKKALLAQESKYKTIQQEGFYEFMNEEDSPLDEDELKGFVELEEFDKEYPDEEEEEVTSTHGKPLECIDCKKYHENDHQISSNS